MKDQDVKKKYLYEDSSALKKGDNSNALITLI